MNQVSKIAVSLLLLFNGTGAIFGGYNLMAYPDGSSLQVSLDWLRYSPFTDFFIPGLILLCANGVFSFIALAALILRYRFYAWLIIGQGVVLAGWIVIQMLMLRTVNILHAIFGSVASLLILLGWLLLKTVNGK